MITLLVILAVSCQFLIAASFSPPKYVRIGGLFSQFDLNNAVQPNGRQLLAAFLMAVRDINTDHKILPNTTILVAVKDSKLSVGKTFFDSLNLATKSFQGAGIDACIGSYTSGETAAAATVFTQFSTPQISYSSTSPQLSTKINYPFFARTCPSDAFQGAAIADLVFKYYGWTKVSTFANSDAYGSSAVSQFQNSAIDLGVQILSSSLFPVGQTNFQIPIANALKAGTKIFVFFLAAVDMGNLLIQGHDAGLFVEGTQVIAGDAGMIRVVWANMPVGTVTTYMKGILGFAPASDYSTPQGQKFLKSYIKTNITTADPVTGICNNETDDSGEYLYKSILDPAHPTTYTCSGFNSSAYNADGSNLDIYIPYAYDATLAIAMAIHVVLYNQKKSLTGKAIYAALINNVSFSGISGAVNFSRALTTDSTRYAEGDRRTGVRYNILNFNSAVYDSDPQGASGFVSVGHWTKESGNVITAPIMYSTADNSPPSDIPPLINQTITVFFIIILQTLGTLLFITITFVAGILIAFRKTRLLKAIQLRMQAMIIIGGLLGSARVITGFLPVSDINCSLNVWLGHLAFWFIFCPMMLKTWRVHKIVNNKTLKRVKVTENSSVIIFLCVLAPIVFYLAILQSLHAFTPIRITKTFIVGIQYYSDQQCSARHFGFETALIVLEACLLGATAHLCYITKNVFGILNEANNNMRSILIVTVVGAVIIPLTSVSNMEQGVNSVITSSCIFICVFGTFLCLHGNRTVLLLQNYDVDSHLHLRKRSSVFARSKWSSKENDRLPESVYGVSTMNPFEAVKSKNLLNRRQTCNEQVVHWTSVLRQTEALMLIQEDVRRTGAEDTFHVPVGKQERQYDLN